MTTTLDDVAKKKDAEQSAEQQGGVNKLLGASPNTSAAPRTPETGLTPRNHSY